MAQGFLVPLVVALGAPDPLPLVTVDRDNVVITESCRVRVTASPIVDADNNGVIRIQGRDITVTFEGEPLVGAEAGATPDSFMGNGIRITGRDVSL